MYIDIVEFLSAENVDLLLKSRVLAFSTFGSRVLMLSRLLINICFAPLAINAIYRDTMWKYQFYFYLIKCKYTVVRNRSCVTLSRAIAQHLNILL